MQTLGDIVSDGLGSARLKAGLRNLKGLFQCKLFYNSMKNPEEPEERGMSM